MGAYEATNAHIRIIYMYKRAMWISSELFRYNLVERGSNISEVFRRQKRCKNGARDAVEHFTFRSYLIPSKRTLQMINAMIPGEKLSRALCICATGFIFKLQVRYCRDAIIVYVRSQKCIYCIYLMLTIAF